MMLLALVLPAWSGEFRKIELADGRILVAEVTGTYAEGLALRVPQGMFKTPFDDILRIDPVDESVYRSLPALRVLVLPVGARDGLLPNDADLATKRLRTEMSRVPGTRVLVLEDLPAGTPSATLHGCGLDASCVLGASGGLAVDVIVMGMLGAPGGAASELTLSSVWSGATRAQRRTSIVRAGTLDSQIREIDAATYVLLAVEAERAPVVAVAPFPTPVPGAVPTPVPTPLPVVIAAPVATPAVPSPTPITQPASGTSIDPALAFVPIPGFPSWLAGDYRGGVIATAIVIPATALVVWAAGHESPSPAAFGLLAGVGYYAVCAATNRAVLPVAITPTVGGAAVQVGGTF